MKKILRYVPYTFIIFLRVFLPVLFFENHSLYLVIALTLIDLYDAEFAANGILSKEWYQKLDKLLDFWWYEWILTYILVHFYNLSAFFIILFIYRMIGQMLIMTGVNRKILFFFPNLYEAFFFLFFFSLNVEWLHFLIEGRMLYYSFAGVIIFKFLNEYFIHVKDLSLKEILFGSKRVWIKGGV